MAGSKRGVAVAASELGLSPSEWDESLELEAFCKYPYEIKEIIEKSATCTGAQSLQLLCDLKLSCEGRQPMLVQLNPATPSLAERTRQTQERPWGVLHESIDTGRAVMAAELASRMFLLRPSNARLVQCFIT